jgi:hypothetical protein
MCHHTQPLVERGSHKFFVRLASNSNPLGLKFRPPFSVYILRFKESSFFIPQEAFLSMECPRSSEMVIALDDTFKWTFKCALYRLGT